MGRWTDCRRGGSRGGGNCKSRGKSIFSLIFKNVGSVDEPSNWNIYYYRMSHGSYVDPRHLLGGRQLSALHAGGGGGGMKTHLDKFKVLFPMGTLIVWLSVLACPRCTSLAACIGAECRPASRSSPRTCCPGTCDPPRTPGRRRNRTRLKVNHRKKQNIRTVSGNVWKKHVFATR